MTRPDHLLEREKDSRAKAKETSRIKVEPHPIVLTSEDIGSRHHQRLATLEVSNFPVVFNVKGKNGAIGNGLIDPSVQLAKSRKGSETHPNNEMFIHHTINWTDDLRVRLVKILGSTFVWIKVGVALVVLHRPSGCLARPLVSVATSSIILAQKTLGRLVRAQFGLETIWLSE